MITEHKNIKKFSLLLYIIGIVITIAASYCLKSDRLFIILLCCIEMGTTIYFIKRKDKNYLLQWTSIVVIFTLFFDVLLFTGENTEILMRGLELFACNVSFIISLVVLWKQKNKKSVYFDRILRENWYLLGIVLLFVIGCIPILDSWLGSGSYDYYSALQELNSWNYVDLSRFKLAGHQSQAFAFFLALGEFITPGNPVGARIMQIIMGISGILCFDLLIDKLFPGIKKSITIIALLLFSFSPLFFGLIGELNPDFAVLIFFMWFITSYAYKKYIFLIFSGVCLCLSKETGIIIYAAFVIGTFLFKFFTVKKKFWNKMNDTLSNKLMISSCISGYIFLFIYFRDMSMWDGGIPVDNPTRPYNTFGVDAEYIIFKLKQLLTPNFSWIFLIFITGLLLYLFYRKVRKRYITEISTEITEVITGIYFSFAAYIVLSLFYITWTNYRYVIPYIFFVIFTIVLLIYLLDIQNKLIVMIQVGILGITFASNFFTLDTVFKPSQYSYDMGDIDVLNNMLFYSTREGNMKTDEKAELYGTTTYVYNRQYIHMGEAIENIVDRLELDKNTGIILPKRLDHINTCMAYFARRNVDNLYYNIDEKKLTVNSLFNDYSGDENYEKVHFIVSDFTGDQIERFEDYSSIYVMEFPFMEEYNQKYHFPRQDKEVIDHKGYTINMYKIK